MRLKRTDHSGGGIILELTKKELLKLAPKVYSATWKALLTGKGDFALILGAGTAEREVFFGLDRKDLNRYQLPTIHCYDLAKQPPAKFLERRNQFPNVSIKYFTNSDLNNFKPLKEYYGNTRLVSLHGVLDYLRPNSVSRFLSQIVAIRPYAISIRFCLIRGYWLKKFASKNQLISEMQSIKNLLTKKISTINLQTFQKQAIIQLSIPNKDKLQYNLSTDYPACFILPDKLVGLLKNAGYNFPLVERYNGRYANLLLFTTCHSHPKSNPEPDPPLAERYGVNLTG